MTDPMPTRDPGHSHTRDIPCRPEDCTGHPEWEAIRQGRPTPVETLYLWMGSPTDAPEHLLMVLSNNPEHGRSWTPLLATTREAADAFAAVASQAADSLGVPAVLRAYQLDRGPGDVPVALDILRPTR